MTSRLQKSFSFGVRRGSSFRPHCPVPTQKKKGKQTSAWQCDFAVPWSWFWLGHAWRGSSLSTLTDSWVKRGHCVSRTPRMPHLANDSPLLCHFLVPLRGGWSALDQDVNKRTTYAWGLAGVHVRVSGMAAYGIMVRWWRVRCEDHHRSMHRVLYCPRCLPDWPAPITVIHWLFHLGF